VANLTRLYLWRKAGYAIAPDELDADQWDALAAITRWYEVKDIEDQARLSLRAVE
jgi:hypothetical protein